ncbi:hypothetical protein C9926_02670, partial [Sulfurovum lithotrophicum]
MKQIILTILFISNMYAQTTQKDICQFKKVTKNGWNENNQTLNQKIIDLGKIEIPRILQNLQQPLTPDENKSAISPFPKFKLTRNDYIKLFAYTKYLESENKIDDIIQIYINSYVGLTHIKMSSYIPFITLIALNKEINKNLNSNLTHHIFTEYQKEILYKNLSSLLIINNKKLLETLESEKNIILNFVKIAHVAGDYIIDSKHLQLFKKQWLIASDKNYNMFLNNMSSKGINTIINNKQKERDSISLITHLKMKLLKYKIKFYNAMSITITKSDYLTLT